MSHLILTDRSKPRWMAAAGVALSVFFLFSGCKKDDSPGSLYTVTGTVYEDCALKPFANGTLELVHYTNMSMYESYQSVSTQTDDFGNFIFNYTSGSGNSSLTDEYQVIVRSGKDAGRLLMSRIPGKQNAKLGNLYVNNKIRVYLDLKTDSGGYETDTLYFGLSADQYHAIYPIRRLQNTYEFNANVKLYSAENRFHINGVNYAIGLANYKASFQTAGFETKILSAADCSSRNLVDTVRISLP